MRGSTKRVRHGLRYGARYRLRHRFRRRLRVWLYVAPETAFGRARFALELREERPMMKIGGNAHDLGVAALHHLRVDHGVAHPDVREQTLEAIAALAVELQPDPLAADEIDVQA